MRLGMNSPARHEAIGSIPINVTEPLISQGFSLDSFFAQAIPAAFFAQSGIGSEDIIFITLCFTAGVWVGAKIARNPRLVICALGGEAALGLILTQLTHQPVFTHSGMYAAAGTLGGACVTNLRR